MNRMLLFMTGLALPVVIQAQGADANDFGVRDNWDQVAAGGGRLFFALLVGMLLAYAFQWILTCLSLATGATVAGKATRRMGRRSYYREDRHRHEDTDRHEDGRFGDRHEKNEAREEDHGYRTEKREKGWESPVMKIQAGAGIWALVTTAISLFLATWLAAELIRFGGRAEAVILGLAVWAGFMLSMIWMEASMLGSMLSGLFNAFKGGLKTAAAPLKSAAGSLAGKASESAEEIAAKVREEFRTQGGGEGIQEKLRVYMDKVSPRTLDRSQLEQEVDELFEDPEIREAAFQSGQGLDRRRFQEIAAGRGDFPPDEQRLIVEVLSSRWNRLAQESRKQGSWSPAEAHAGVGSQEIGASEARGIETGRGLETPSMAGETAARSSEVSGKPYSTASGPYATAGSPATASGTRTLGAPGFQARFQAFKDFLRNSDKRDLNPVRIEQEVESLVIHPEEGHANMERSVKEMNREEVAQTLRSRRDLTLQEADSIADLIDAARIRMLSRSEIREHRVQESTDKALARIRDYVYALKRPEMDYDGFKSDFEKLLEDPKGGFDSLKSRISGIDRDTLVKTFAARKGVSQQEAEKMAEQAEAVMHKAGENARKIEEETRRRVEAMRRASLEQAEATRKVAAAAAWWLVVVAVVSGAAAALGGLTGAAS